MDRAHLHHGTADEIEAEGGADIPESCAAILGVLKGATRNLEMQQREKSSPAPGKGQSLACQALICRGGPGVPGEHQAEHEARMCHHVTGSQQHPGLCKMECCKQD